MNHHWFCLLGLFRHVHAAFVHCVRRRRCSRMEALQLLAAAAVLFHSFLPYDD
jgi:hypothetical protein